MPRPHPDVLVIGGGPAGCAAARLLATWGHDVLLITKPNVVASTKSTSLPLSESIPPSARKLWSVLGVDEAIERAEFVRATGNTVWWGSESRVEPFADGGRGWQVTDASLAAVLLTEAMRAGVRVESRLVGAAEAARAPAMLRLDCTGRTGLLARVRGGRAYEPDLRTVALAAHWRHAGAWPLDHASHTLIESYADGWAWSVPLADGRRSVAVMVDPSTTDLVRGRGARETYLAELAKTARFVQLLNHAELEGKPAGWDASMYSSTNYAGDDWLLVGDAGSFVDPLSSAGVTKALASGWLAAIVAHTTLLRPSMAGIAREFFAAREREVYAGLRRQTRAFLAQAADGESHPFWNTRIPTPDVDQSTTTPVQADERAVKAAWDRLRAAAAITLRRGGRVTIAERPAISAAEIVMERRLVESPIDVGVRYIRDVDIVSLIELAPAHAQVPDLFDAYIRHTGPISLPDFLTALSTIISRGWLVLA